MMVDYTMSRIKNHGKWVPLKGLKWHPRRKKRGIHCSQLEKIHEGINDIRRYVLVLTVLRRLWTRGVDIVSKIKEKLPAIVQPFFHMLKMVQPFNYFWVVRPFISFCQMIRVTYFTMQSTLSLRICQQLCLSFVHFIEYMSFFWVLKGREYSNNCFWVLLIICPSFGFKRDGICQQLYLSFVWVEGDGVCQHLWLGFQVQIWTNLSSKKACENCFNFWSIMLKFKSQQSFSCFFLCLRVFDVFNFK